MINGKCGYISLEEWHLMEQMMCHVCATNLVMEEIEYSVRVINSR